MNSRDSVLDEKSIGLETMLLKRWLRSPAFWPVLIGGLGLAIRMGYALIATQVDPFLRQNPLYGDAASYDRIVRSLLAGTGYSQYPPLPGAFWPPLYPIFLWGVYLLGGYNLLLGRVVQAIVGALVPVTVYLIGRRLFKAQVALLAACGMVFYPYLIYFGAWLIAESLYIALLSFTLLVAVVMQRRPNAWLSMVLGVLLGLDTLAKPVTLFFLPFVALWFLLSLNAQPVLCRLKLGILALALMLSVLAPWIIRNYTLYGDWFISLNGGYTFYGANNPHAFGGHREGFPPRIPGLSEAEQQREYYRLGFTWIKENPDDFLHLVLKKYARLFSPLSVASWESDYPLPFAGVVRSLYWAFLACVAVGFAKSLTCWRRALILYIPIGGVLLSTLVFYGDTRYALPMIPSLLLFAAETISEGCKRIKIC